jgi:hypothetical protein
MSYRLITQVWQLKLKPVDQQVLMALADYADDDGCRCFPSQPRLAWKTGLSESTIIRTLDKLIAIGIIKVVRPATNKTPAHYQIEIDKGEMKAPFESDNVDFRGVTVPPQDQSRDSSVTPQDSLGWHSDTSRDSTVTARDSSVTPDPIINQSFNKSDNGNGPFPETATEKGNGPDAETARIWALLRPELCVGRSFVDACLQGSELMATATILDGKPLYRLLVVKPDNLDWLRTQIAGQISSRLRVILKKRISLEIVAELGCPLGAEAAS